MFTSTEAGIGLYLPKETCLNLYDFSYNHVKDLEEIYNYIEEHKRCTTIILHSDKDAEYVNLLATCIKDLYDKKVAYFTEEKSINCAIQKHIFDYIKIGPYIPSRGDYHHKTTNQRVFKIKKGKLTDITQHCYEN